MIKNRLLIFITIGIVIVLGAGGFLFFSGCTGGAAYVLSGTLYIGGYSTEKIYAVDLGNTAAIESIDLPTGAQPDWLTLSPDKTKLYCSSESNIKVYIINTVTNEYEKEVNVCTGPRGIAFTPDGTIAAVVCNGGGDVALIDTATGTYNNNSADTIPYMSDSGEKYGIAIHPTLNKCYVTSGTKIMYGDVAGGTIMTETYSIISSGIYDVEVSSDGSRVYSSALITDPALYETVVTLSVNGGTGALSQIGTAECVSNNLKKLRLSPDENKVYVPMLSVSAIDYMDTDDTSTMSSIDLSSYSQSGVQDVVFSADSKKAFVVIDSTTDSIIVIDTATSTVDEQIALPDCDPKSLAFKQ